MSSETDDVDRPAVDRPAVDRPAVDRPAVDRHGEDRHGEDRHVVARRCAEAMWEADLASRRLGMRLVDVSPGVARLTMRVTEEMVNGHGTCHGGYLAVLADSAFAFACNTEDEVTVAAGFDIVFAVPAVLGDHLTAVATERVRYGRSGVYDVTVTRDDGTVIAEYRGRSRSLGRPLLTPEVSS